MAEGMFRHHLDNTEIGDKIEVDSAGTGGWHTGQSADQRMSQVAINKGVELTSRARKVTSRDFEYFDYLVAMDHLNFSDLLELCPDQFIHKVLLMRDFDDQGTEKDVPDPYYGGDQGFEDVYQILNRSTLKFLTFTIDENNL